MSIVNTTECIICYNEYDTETRKPCIGTCGHSICEGCKHQMVSSKCPQCNREEAFAITTINYQVLELIKHFKSMQAGETSTTPQKLFNEETRNLDEGVCSECSLQSRKLRICMTCAEAKGVLQRGASNRPNDFQLIIVDGNVEEAIQKAKAHAICGDCALDGVQHESHKTMPLANLRNNLDDVALKTVERKIQAMDDNAEVVSKRLFETFAGAITSLRNYFKVFEVLSPAERKLHFNNVEANVEQMNNTIAMVEDSCKRLELLTEEFTEQEHRVQESKKAFCKSSIVFASSDPVLVADRKQSAKEPLLIGVFNPKNNGWQPVGRMPNPKSNYAVASNKSQIFIVGGMNNGSWLNTLEMYDKDKNLRRDCAKMKKGRTRTSAGFHNSKLYVTGGYDGGYMNSVEYYDPENGDWKEGPPLQRARADAAVVSCNGDLYVLGGFNGKEYEEKIEKLNDSTQKFEVVGDMMGSRAGFGACSFKGRIYVAGGWSNSSNTLKSVRSFDPLTKSWRDEPSLQKDRKYFTLHSTNDAVYAVRGCADSWGLINEVERLDAKVQVWQTIPCLPIQQMQTAAAAAAAQAAAAAGAGPPPHGSPTPQRTSND